MTKARHLHIAVSGPSLRGSLMRGFLGAFCIARRLRRAGKRLASTQTIEPIVHRLTPTGPAQDWKRHYDAVVIAGGHDIHPSRYGQHPPTPHQPQGYNPERDELELGLLERAAQRSTPVLGVCRGLQLINVYLGGTLVSDIETELDIDNPQCARACKTVHLADGGLLRQRLECDSLRVNSLHHQAIDTLAPSLLAAGQDEFGIIQAVEHRSPQLAWLGVQWHPEYLFRSVHRCIFEIVLELAASSEQA